MVVSRRGSTTSLALTWTHSISHSSFHNIPQASSVAMHGAGRLRVHCTSDPTQKAADRMTVSVSGATGFIGGRSVQRLHAVGEFPGIVTAGEEQEWKDSIQGANAVVNLAGMPINTRWSPEIKKEIKRSRIRVTSKVVDLINDSPEGARPIVRVSATAVGCYGTRETQAFDERSPPGNDYLAEVCWEWEGMALKVNKDGAKMIPLFMMFAGGPLGSRQQWFSLNHVDNMVNLLYEALLNPSCKGVTAANPVRLGEMCQQLGNVLSRLSWLP